MAGNTVTWLHLSDLHMCSAKTGWDAREILRTLQVDLQFLQNEHGLAPDLLFFTGDLAYGHVAKRGWLLQQQYGEVEKFLYGVRHCMQPRVIPKDRVFLVPGNHDVDRAVIDRKLTKTINRLKTMDEVTGFLEGPHWNECVKRLDAYREFLQANGYDHLLAGPDHRHLIYGNVVDVHGVRVGVGGLNSAWSCTGKEKRGTLRVGARWQAQRVSDLIGDADVKIGLIHHPLRWLHDGEVDRAPVTIESTFEFFLHGHEHYIQVAPQDNGHHRISAGACYQHSEQENAYNIVRLDLNQGTGEVWLRRFDPSGGGWVPRPYYNGSNDVGVWSLKEKALEKLGTRFRQAVVSPAPPDAARPDLGMAVCFKQDGPRKFKFLLILTSKKRRIFPKRTTQRELTAERVAIGVAAVEGGVEGVSRGELESRYEYTNDGSTQTMAAFLVEHQQTVKPEQRWRKPRWFSYDGARKALAADREPAQAAQLIKILDDAWQKLTC